MKQPSQPALEGLPPELLIRGSREGEPLETPELCRRVSVRIVAPLLLEIFKRNVNDPAIWARVVTPDIPADAKVVGVSLDPYAGSDVFIMILESASFAPVPWGQQCPELLITFHQLP